MYEYATVYVYLRIYMVIFFYQKPKSLEALNPKKVCVSFLRKYSHILSCKTCCDTKKFFFIQNVKDFLKFTGCSVVKQNHLCWATMLKPLTTKNEKFKDFCETSTANSSWYAEFRTF